MKRTLLLIGFISMVVAINAHGNKTIKKIESAFQSGKLNYEEALLQKFYTVFDKSKLKNEFASAAQYPVKCATHLIAEYEKNRERLTEKSRNIISDFLYAKEKNGNSVTIETYTSPYNKFEITYSTTGDDAVSSQDLDNSGVPDYVERIAEYFDRSWRVLIDTLGYEPIPLYSGDYYQVSLESMSAYGYTYYNQSAPGGTAIVMHNTYMGFPPNTDPDGNILGAAKVTAVHEFKHAIQFIYSNWQEMGWFIEADATWAEDIAFDKTNDYYNYLNSSQIQQPGRGLQDGDGYEDNLFFHFFTEKFSVDINGEIWVRRTLYNESVFSSIENVLSNYGTSFENAVSEYFIWLYNCGTNNNSNLPSFDEAEFYPNPKFCDLITSLPKKDQGCERGPISSSFLKFNSQGQDIYLQVILDTPNGNNIAAVIINYENSTTDITYNELNNTDLFDLFIEPKLNEIESVAVILTNVSTYGSVFDYMYTFKEFKSAVFSHQPFEDTETSGELEFTVAVDTPRNLAYIDSLKLFYQFDEGGYQSTSLSPTGNQNEYAITIPDPGYNVQIDYYFRIADQLDEYVFYPSSAPDSVFSFFVGTDVIGPTISHSPIGESTKFDFPLNLYANLSDNTFLDSTYLEYKINDGELNKVSFSQLGDDLYYSIIGIDEQSIEKGDSVFYRLTATDSSSNKNVSLKPMNGFYSIEILEGYKFSSEPNSQIIERPQSNRDMITVEDGIIIDDIDIYIKTDHQKFSDLVIRVLSPDGGTLNLYNQNWLGTPLDELQNPYITFNDEAYFNFEDIIFIDTSNASASVRTNQSQLTDFTGKSTSGNWTIAIFDREENNLSGNLLEWGLIVRGDLSTDVFNPNERIPTEYSLSQNYPNPFNPSTQIHYSIPTAGKVSLKIYDILGSEVAELVDSYKQAGEYQVEFNSAKYGDLSSGIYFVRMISESFLATKKIMLLK